MKEDESAMYSYYKQVSDTLQSKYKGRNTKDLLLY